MQRENVESSMILSIGYESSTSTLEIEFKNGGAIWQYFSVPESLFHELKSAASIGKFFLANIKNQYSESRVG